MEIVFNLEKIESLFLALTPLGRMKDEKMDPRIYCSLKFEVIKLINLLDKF
jgi:hypothetical protein